MEQIALPLVFLLLGLGLKALNILPSGTPGFLNKFVIYVSLPAITLLFIHQMELGTDMLIPAGVAWVIYLVSVPLFLVAGKVFGWGKGTVGALILCCGLGNTSFVGFPVIEALFGDEALKIAVLVDQPGGFLALSTLGIVTAAYFAGEKVSGKILLKKVLLFPSFPIFIISLIMAANNASLPGEVNTVLSWLGKTITPFALTSIGMQLSIKARELQWKPLTSGLAYKLILAPALIFCGFLLLNDSSLTAKVSILEASMGPMISASIVAIQYDLNPRLVGQLAGIGIPVSFLTLAFWYIMV
ncbi:AEC family transporter [Roseivirga sp. BDSF3-8]|uniref:AEC family transporter n=1 Tax=Roseivirga sp. BDSF3-8 TaxID=3241598 RepID=UPI003532033E